MNNELEQALNAKSLAKTKFDNATASLSEKFRSLRLNRNPVAIQEFLIALGRKRTAHKNYSRASWALTLIDSEVARYELSQMNKG